MSEERELNPYAAPQEGKKSVKRTKKKARNDNADEDTIQQIVRSFQKTRSWIAFFGILSYIGAVIAVIGGAFVAFMSSQTRGPLATLGPGVLLVYLVLAVVYVVFGARLLRYRDAIDEVIRSEGQIEHIGNAVERQAQFWSLAGQTCVALLILYGIVVIVGAAAGAASVR